MGMLTTLHQWVKPFQQKILEAVKPQIITMELTLGDLQQIELICVEASAWGLREEVVDAAETLINEGYEPVVAYEIAFEDWVK
jgi:thiazole synthase ThiGH ThiG subunit